MIGGELVAIVCWLLLVAQVILLVHVVFSWIPRPPEPLMPFALGVRRIVEPLAAPIRRVMPQPRIGGVGLDLSILVLFFILFILRAAICGGR